VRELERGIASGILKWSIACAADWRDCAFDAPDRKADESASMNKAVRMSEVGLKEDNSK